MENENEQETDKMRLVTKVQNLLRNIHLGPVVFLFYICFGIFFVTSQQLYIEKACKVNLNYSEEVCDNIKQHNETQIEAQKLISEIQGINGALQSIPTIPVAFLAGPLSDKFSRKPLILCSLGGYILLNIIYMINAFWFYELKMEYLLFECLQDFTGGDLVFSLGINSLLVDLTTKDTRTRHLIMIDAFRYAGRAVGMQVGAAVKKFYGWTSVFTVSFIFLFFNIFYIYFFVKEHKKMSSTSEKGCLKASSDILRSYKQLFRFRKDGIRPLILLVMVALSLFFFSSGGMGPLWYLHLRLQYGIDLIQYANIGVVWAIRSIVTNLVLLPFLLRYLSDTYLVFLSIIITSVASVLWTLGQTYLHALILSPLFAFYYPIEIIMNSIVSQLVSAEEVGTAFSFLAVLSKCIDFVGKPFYGFLYRSTVEIFPGIFLLVSTGFLFVIFGLIVLVHLGLKKGNCGN